MNRKIKVFAAIITAAILFGLFTAAFSPDFGAPADRASAKIIEIQDAAVPLGDTPSSVLMPVASGTDVRKNAKTELDVSNVKDGYFMAKYLEKTSKQLKVIVKSPGGTQYQYSLDNSGKREVYPLSSGNGSYQIGVYESVGDSKYASVFSVTIDVKLSSEYAPFVLPNQYVNYTKDSAAVKKGAELTKNAKNVTEKIEAVYKFVINNISYDKALAASVKAGYLPNVDSVLKNKKGICFDYAALMAAMLRSQGVPTKLVIGYAGDIYHAWINVYSKDVGWINKAIYFDGKTWSLMDPTFVSTGGNSEEVIKYVSNKANYSAKYVY